jgi:dipeptidyl aminopeptidase/acylaminoacyl peptidase
MASRVSDSLWRIKTGSLRKSRVAVSKQVVTSGGTQADPQYSPDGSKIAFTSSRSGSDEIWVSHADGSMAVQLTDLGHPHTGSPHWSPDGTQIVFGSRANGDPDIFVIGSEGGSPRRLTTHAGEDVTPSWSRDGKWIYFASDRSGEFQVWKMPNTGESSAGAVQITHGGGFAPVESRDGKHLYFAKGLGRRGLWRLALKGADNNDKREQPVLDSLEHWGWWALAKEGVYFFNAEPAGSSGIFFDVQPPPKQKVKLNYLNLATGIRSELTTLDRAVSTCNRVMSVSPSGSDLIYEQLDREDADIMMVENFGTGRN